MLETWVSSLGWEDPLEEGMATHSSILAWRIPWTASPASPSPRGRKELDRTERLTLYIQERKGRGHCGTDQWVSGRYSSGRPRGQGTSSRKTQAQKGRGLTYPAAPGRLSSSLR